MTQRLDSINGVQNLPQKVLVALFTNKHFLTNLSKNDIIDLMSLLSLERKRRFKRKKDKRYGNINRGFTPEELQLYFSQCTNDKEKLASKMQAYLGLRVGEVAVVKLEHINFSRRTLSVYTLKAHTGDELYLHDEIFETLLNWVTAHLDKIKAADGYVLFSDNPNRKCPHVSPHWLRNEFRVNIKAAGLDGWYGKSDEVIEGRRSRCLYRLTRHSFRHYFGTRFYEETHDPVATQRVLRHTDLKSTQTYINSSKNNIAENMSRAFDKSFIDKQREEEEVRKMRAILKIIR